MKVITSYDAISEKDKNLFERIIPNSMELLKSLERSFKGKPIIEKYLNVLFSFRSSADGYRELNDIIDRVRKAGDLGYPVDKHVLQRKIKEYLTHIDSTLDIHQKFTNQLKEENIVKEKFNRELDKVSVEISTYRNQELHEKVPEIEYYTERSFVSCPTDISGIENIQCTIKVKFGHSKAEDLGVFVTHTFFNTRKLIQKIINLSLHT
jgi:hypothetical protein